MSHDNYRNFVGDGPRHTGYHVEKTLEEEDREERMKPYSWRRGTLLNDVLISEGVKVLHGRRDAESIDDALV